MQTLQSFEIYPSSLMAEYPPVYFTNSKKLINDIASQSKLNDVIIKVAQYGVAKLPKTFEQELEYRIHPKVMDYHKIDGHTTWAVNFADDELFGFYSYSAFAQDEIQVAEHPVLASIREKLLLDKMNAQTTDQEGDPTPFLIQNAPRQCSINLDPLPHHNLPNGIYGKSFGQANSEAVINSVELIEQATLSNIIAMSSISDGQGIYSDVEIAWLLSNAYTAFKAAVELSEGYTHIQTGFWGCGAFGGNRILSCAIQYIAASMAKVKVIEFCRFTKENEEYINKGVSLATEIIANNNGSTLRIIEELSDRNFLWGASDGN